MSMEELSAESKWHAYEALSLLDEVKVRREAALGVNEEEAEAALLSAAEMESEAEAHLQQSNLLDSLQAARLSDQGVGVVMHAGKS